MCGIAGIIAGDSALAQRALSHMIPAIAHRGPDDSGEQIIASGPRVVGLGHRRLSILDLSPAGHQPMIDPESRDQIIFNGEIYNFPLLAKELEADGVRFVGHSDTEVLLRGLSRWGTALLSRLEGMFAFAYYSARDGTLLLARDPVGIKPLYYAAFGADGLVFASELRAIMASGVVEKTFDPAAVATLLAYGAVQEPQTIVRGVKAFPPGCFQILQSRDPHLQTTNIAPTPFWSYPRCHKPSAGEDVVSAVRNTLDMAVRDHLISDVPVGVFLSSGIDSSIVAALAAKHGAGLRSFTVGFGEHPELSELPLAAQTARSLGLSHTEVEISAQEALAETIQWIDSLDQPSMDGFNVYVISKAVRAHGIKVALSGQGGDELFGGYPSFSDVPRIRRLYKSLRWLPRGARAWVGGRVPGSQAQRLKLQDMMRSDGSIRSLCLHRRRVMSDSQLDGLGIRAADLGLSADYEPMTAASVNGDDFSDPICAISRTESRYYMGNMLLRDGDACSMAHGLEVRVPMLDKRLLDLVLPLPGDVRLPSGKADKHLLRQAFAPLLRDDVLQQKKRGFVLPIRSWMLGPLRELCDGALDHLKKSGLVTPNGVDAVWQSFADSPDSPSWSRAFTLCVLGHYLRRTGLQP